MKINVTKKNIRNGIRSSGTACPIARALQELFGCVPIHVGDCEIQVDNKWYNTPVRVERFIHAFDSGRQVKPISFNLPLTKSK